MPIVTQLSSIGTGVLPGTGVADGGIGVGVSWQNPGMPNPLTKNNLHKMKVILYNFLVAGVGFEPTTSWL